MEQQIKPKVRRRKEIIKTGAEKKQKTEKQQEKAMKLKAGSSKRSIKLITSSQNVQREKRVKTQITKFRNETSLQILLKGQ